MNYLMNEEEILERYEINEETLALLPNNKKETIVIEKNRSFKVKEDATQIMKFSCEYFGSSLSGRQRGTTSLIGVTHKVPVIVEESREIIFFPTNSPRLKNCGWLSFNNIKNYKKDANGEGTIVEFKTGKSINIDLSYGSLDNQILRAAKLNLMLKDRKDFLPNNKSNK